MRFVYYYARSISDPSGVTTALWSWAGALAAAGHEVEVLHAGGPRRVAVPHTARLAESAIAHAGASRSTWYPLALGRHLRRGDVLVLHEGWVLSNLVAARAARRVGVPYVVVPHGAYEPGVQRRLKPIVRVRRHLERQLLERALAVHVFFPSEVATIGRLAARARCIVAPTGQRIPAERWDGAGGYVAWLGRYDPGHKGLDILLRGLASLPAASRPTLRLRGYDFQGGRRTVLGLTQELGLAEAVDVGGPLPGEEKLRFLQHAAGYVHPSRWESHSIALLESLALGVPTIASASMHISAELQAAKAAIVVEPTVAGVAAGLGELLDGGSGVGPRGRELIAERFSWDHAVSSLLDGLEPLIERRVVAGDVSDRPAGPARGAR